MLRRLFVTLALLSQLGATAPPNPHVISVRVPHMVRIGSDHLVLGVIVLGHHVGRLEAGWLVKAPPSNGYLHIDWSRSADWHGLTRGAEGPRDVSQKQLDEVVQTIEKLGFDASAIRAWRVAAPVGYDGFNEGDKVLTIGEILVDLGRLDEAKTALEHWWSVIEDDKNDPFAKIPLTNVRYYPELYLQTDCSAELSTARDETIPAAQQQADAIAHAVLTTATFSSFQPAKTPELLCPQGIEPEMKSGGGPPIRIYPQELEQPEIETVNFDIGGLSDDVASLPQTVPNALQPSDLAYAFALPESYAATIGSGACGPATPVALNTALAESRHKADAIARVFGVHVTGLGAARISSDAIGCTKSTVDAAWILGGIPRPGHALTSLSYSGSARSPVGSQDALAVQALVNTAREAYVDNPQIFSVYEGYSSSMLWHGATQVDDTLVVQR